jgi:SAM-dependent methyltransferase
VVEVSAVTRQNARYWEAIAPYRPGEPAEFFLAGGLSLMDEELAVTGEVAGKRVLHLASAVGNEAISFARLGAVVTAVDISPAHLACGRAKAAAVGVDVDFIEADMMALPGGIGGFDVIYISWGGLRWVPDLDQWAPDVARRLADGGLLVIAEHHPLHEVLSVTGPGGLAVSRSYFEPDRVFSRDIRRPSGHVQAERELNRPLPASTSFVWGLGTVVSAVLGAGLRLTSLREYADPEMYPGLDDDAARAIPSIYILAAQR